MHFKVSPSGPKFLDGVTWGFHLFPRADTDVSFCRRISSDGGDRSR